MKYASKSIVILSVPELRNAVLRATYPDVWKNEDLQTTLILKITDKSGTVLETITENSNHEFNFSFESEYQL